MFVDVFAHIHTSKGEKSKKGVGGSARARFGAPFRGTQRKVAVFLPETQFPLCGGLMRRMYLPPPSKKTWVFVLCLVNQTKSDFAAKTRPSSLKSTKRL